MKNAIIASLASIPFAVAGVFSAGAANAAALTGHFGFDGIDNPTSYVGFDTSMIDFKTSPAGGDPQISIKNFSPVSSGSFLGFNSAYIYDATFGGVPSLFMDLGAEDGLDTLTVTGFMPGSHFGYYDLVDKGATTDVNLGFWGEFTSATGEVSNAEGSLTFQYAGTFAETKSALESGQMLNGTFSGAVIAGVPEPTTMLGLGVVAAASAFGLKKKNS